MSSNKMKKTQDIDELFSDDCSDTEDNLNLEKLQIGSPEKGGRGERRLKQQQQQQHITVSPLPSPSISATHQNHHHHHSTFDGSVTSLGPLWKDYPHVQKTVPSSYSFCSSQHQAPPSTTTGSYYNITAKTAINPPPLFRNYRSSSMASLFGGPKPPTLLSPPKLLDYSSINSSGGLCSSTCSRPESGSFSPYASCYSGYSGRFNGGTGTSINGLDLIEPLSRSSSQSSGFVSQTGGIHTPPPSNNNHHHHHHHNNNNNNNLSSSNCLFGGERDNTSVVPSSSSSSFYGGRNMIQHHNTGNHPISSSQYQTDEQQSFVSFSTMTTNRHPHHNYRHPHAINYKCNSSTGGNPLWPTSGTTTTTMTSLFKPMVNNINNNNNNMNGVGSLPSENGNTCSRFAPATMTNEGPFYLKRFLGIRRTMTTGFCLNNNDNNNQDRANSDGGQDFSGDESDDDDDDNASFKSALTSLTITRGNKDSRNKTNNNNSNSYVRHRNSNDNNNFYNNNNTTSKKFAATLPSSPFGHYHHHNHHHRSQQHQQQPTPMVVSSKSTRSKNSILSGPSIRNLRAKSLQSNAERKEKEEKRTTQEKGWVSTMFSFILQLFWRLSLFLNIVLMFWLFFGSPFDSQFESQFSIHHLLHNMTDTVVKNTPILWETLVNNFLEILSARDLFGQEAGRGGEFHNSNSGRTKPTVLVLEYGD